MFVRGNLRYITIKIWKMLGHMCKINENCWTFGREVSSTKEGEGSFPETSASPTRVSAAVTGMFHTLQSDTIGPRQTLPDSAGLPPGLSSTIMDPFRHDPLLAQKD